MAAKIVPVATLPALIILLTATTLSAASFFNPASSNNLITGAYALNPQPLPPGLLPPYVLLQVANGELSGSESLLLASGHQLQQPPDPCLSVSTVSRGCVALLESANNLILNARTIVNNVAGLCQHPPDPCKNNPTVSAQLQQVVSTTEQIIDTANALKNQIPPGPPQDILSAIIGEAQSISTTASGLLSSPGSGPPLTSG